MSFLLGTKSGKVPASTVPRLVAGFRGQTSTYGTAIPIPYGTNRLSPSFIWFGDFTPIPHSSPSSGGGKGFGSSSQQSNSSVSYTYTGAALLLLSEGPIQNLLNIFETKGYRRYTDGQATRTLSAGHATYQASPVGSAYSADLGVSMAQAYNYTVTDYGNPSGAQVLSGTQQIAMLRVGSSPGPGQYTVTGGGLYTFNAADAAAGLVITAYWRYSPSSLPTGFTQIAYAGWTLFTGTRPQSPWGYLTSKHPGQDLGYDGCALLGSTEWNLGSQGAMQNLNFEVQGFFPLTGGILDANPAVILNDLLTNPDYGAEFPSSMIGDWSGFSNYCLANNILLSTTIDVQQTAAKWIQDILDACNAEIVWSQGKLKIVPYADTSAVANGVLFTPNTTPIYDLTDDDFQNTGSDPVEMLIPSANTIENSVQVEWLNRANDYNPEIIEEKDDGSIFDHGIKHAAVRQLHGICNLTTATVVANLILKRSVYIRKTFRFTTDFRYCLLEPMDLVTLTDLNLGLNKKPVRITSMTETKDGQIQFEAEEFPWGTAAPTLYPKQAPAPYIPNTQALPGNINTPIIFEPPARINKYGGKGYEIWFGISGQDKIDFGGCEVWWSLDNSNFERLLTFNSNSRMGLLTGNFPSHADPDTADTLSIDLAESGGVITAGAQADADGLRTLCLLQGQTTTNEELISYSDATLVSGNAYNLGTYIRRGCLNSGIFNFAIGDNFLRLDDAVEGFAYDSKLVGSTIFFKFLSFNVYGNSLQRLPDVSAYPYIVQGGWGLGEPIPGLNALVNPGFELNTVQTASSLVGPGMVFTDGWSFLPTNNSPNDNYMFIGRDTIDPPHSGTASATWQSELGSPIPSDGVVYRSDLGTALYPVKAGDLLFASAWLETDTGALGLPVGVTGGAYVAVQLLAADRTILGYFGQASIFVSGAGANIISWQNLRGSAFAVPSLVGGVAPAFARFILSTSIQNSSGAPWTPHGPGSPPTTYWAVAFDDCVFIFAPNHSQGTGGSGSIPLSVIPPFSYAAGGVGSTSITISWGNELLRRIDGTTVAVSTGSITVTGLTAATQYVFYPYWDEDLQAIHLVGVSPDVGTNHGAASNGDGAVAYTVINGAARAAQLLYYHTPLSLGGVPITTGSGSGTAGGTVQ